MLAGLLWGESPEAEARASLRQALKHLRDAVGDLLQADRAVVSIWPIPIACDVLEFREAVRTGLRRAPPRSTSPGFSEGFSVRHAAAVRGVGRRPPARRCSAASTRSSAGWRARP